VALPVLGGIWGRPADSRNGLRTPVRSKSPEGGQICSGAVPVGSPSPMLAQLGKRLPRGAQWRYEPKLDGFRGLLWHRTESTVQLLSRNTRDLSPWFLSFARSAPPRASPRPRPPGGGPPSVLAARRAEFGSHPRRGMASHVADRGCRGKVSRWPLRSWSPRLGKGKATGHSRLRRDLSRREARSAGVGARAASC